MEEKIRIENVTKKFGSYAALDGISLSFEKGKIHGMIGRNGSGKTVLVMLGSLVGLVIVAYLLLCLLISVGCIYPANYAEQKINEAYDLSLIHI